MIKFSKEKVLLLHRLIAEETGGSIGVRYETLLESALENVFSGFGGNSINAGLYFFKILAATKSIFSSSVMSIKGELSKSTNIYLGRLFLKITACPFVSAMRVTREKF